MNAGKININGIFNGARKLEVPFYQRAYVWDEEQWDRLLEDLAYITATNNTYFIGSIILKQAKVNTWEVVSDKKIVVDGQQRLTTLMLFYKALCLLTNTMDKFNSLFKLEDGSLSLCLGLNDEESLKIVMKQDKPEIIANNDNISNIIPAFNYFITHIVPEKYNRIRINQNLLFVCIDLDEGEDEQQIFDAINSLGVRLTTAELLKNYFYSRESIKEYEDNWVSVFEKDTEAKTYWNYEFEAGRITRSMIDVFFDSYFHLFVQDTKYKVSAEDKILYDRVDNLAKSYQDFIKRYCNGNKQVILGPMAEYAAKFRELFDPQKLNRQVNKDSYLDRINVVIFGLKTSTLIPYILYIAMNSTKEEFDKMLLILESYIMRRLITRATTKNYNNQFSSLILNRVNTADALLEALKQASDSTTYVPSDVALLEGFNTSKLTNLQAKGVIYFIETCIRSEKYSTAILGFNQYSLEHLMPRKWRNHWGPCETAELARARDNKLATLGNFAIITQSLNTSISDSDWSTKKAGKNNNPGLSMCATGLRTMDDVLKEEVWDETKIEARAKWLFDNAKVIWSSVLPAVVEGGGYVDKSGNTGDLRKRFWTYALPIINEANTATGAFSKRNPVRYNELNGYFGISGFSIRCVANLDSAYVCLYLGKSSKEENKKAFDVLLSHKSEIEQSAGRELNWSRFDEGVASWVSVDSCSINLNNEQDWPKVADYLAKWSSRLVEAVLPYLVNDQSSNELLLQTSKWAREWAIQRNDIHFRSECFTKSYTRFTTDAMSEILPDQKGILSSWGIESHYLYEIYVKASGDVLLQLAINSKNITDEYRATCDRIKELYMPNAKSGNWNYRIPFRTKALKSEEVTKEKLFTYLDDCMKQLHAFEKDLKEKL